MHAVYIRPIYSGKAFEKVKVKEGIEFITIRPNNIAPLAKDESQISVMFHHYQ